MDYLKSIPPVNSHIPDKGQVIVCYCSIYFNAHRGKVRKIEEKANSFLIIEQEKQFVLSKSWAYMMGDSIMTTALLDRLLHHAWGFTQDGEFYRIKKQNKEI